MARTFNGTTQYGSNATPAIANGTLPFTFASWIRPGAVGVEHYCFGHGSSGVNSRFILVGVNSSNQVIGRVATGSGEDSSSIVAAGSVSAGTWYHACLVQTAANSRAMFRDGGNRSTLNTVTMSTPNAYTVLSVGALIRNAGIEFPFNGSMAEAAIWDVGLSDDDVASLARGVSPLFVRPQNVIAYWPLIGKESPEPDVTGRYNLTLVAAPTALDHPRTYYRTRARTAATAVIAAPGAPTYLNPADAAFNQPLAVTLTWNAVPTATGYDVYLDTVTPPVTLVSANQPGTTYAATVTPSTPYYWQVVARNPGGSATGAIWSFAGARGNPLLMFDAMASKPPLTNPAGRTTRNGHAVLTFDAAVAESAHFSSILPRHYTGLGLTVRIAWSATTATSGAVTWTIAIERHDPTTDLDVDSFATGVSAAPAPTNAVSGAPTYTEVALTNAQLDGLLAGEHFRLKITRATGGITGDAELYGLDLRETT